jgi:hypothetical protein
MYYMLQHARAPSFVYTLAFVAMRVKRLCESAKRRIEPPYNHYFNSTRSLTQAIRPAHCDSAGGRKRSGVWSLRAQKSSDFAKSTIAIGPPLRLEPSNRSPPVGALQLSQGLEICAQKESISLHCASRSGALANSTKVSICHRSAKYITIMSVFMIASIFNLLVLSLYTHDTSAQCHN